jgi:hypothetical protein
MQNDSPATTTHPLSGLGAAVLLLAGWGALSWSIGQQVWMIREPQGPIETTLGIGFSVVTGMVLLGGARTLILTAAAPLVARAAARRPDTHGGDSGGPSSARVALLLCTADDFDPATLAASLRQTHPSVEAVVLDDSADPEMRRAIDDFALAHGATVVRRLDRSGHKAGNLNHYLSQGLRHDFYAVVDADQILHPRFVELALRRAEASDDIGIVQGRILVHRGTSPFAARFGPLLETYIRVTQTSRSALGLSMFMGRGALIRARCLADTGPVPEVVMEDLALSVEVRAAGHRIVWAPEVLSSEDYPIDYQAFRRQQSKFAQGTVEFLHRYAWRLLRSRLTVREKIDVLLDLVSTPMATGLSIVMFVAGLLPIGPHGMGFLPDEVAVGLAISGAAPLLAEFRRRMRDSGPVSAVVFFAQASALYTSTLWVTLRATGRVLRGRRAVFVITPKRRSAGGLRALIVECALAAALAGVAVAATDGVTAAGAFLAMALASLWMQRLSSRWPRVRS